MIELNEALDPGKVPELRRLPEDSQRTAPEKGITQRVRVMVHNRETTKERTASTASGSSQAGTGWPVTGSGSVGNNRSTHRPREGHH